MLVVQDDPKFLIDECDWEGVVCSRVFTPLPGGGTSTTTNNNTTTTTTTTTNDANTTSNNASKFGDENTLGLFGLTRSNIFKYCNYPQGC
mmetsp:Transcript_7770/g.7630  ORF Transcript_7770/g.7630 Transcript_7770/m.7630 type:complete len:90 (+) Transcript_7770:488-757(+)